MKIGCLQYTPVFGKPSENRKAIQLLLESKLDTSLDVLVLPEMALTGYMFDSSEQVDQFCVDVSDLNDGILNRAKSESSQDDLSWAMQLADEKNITLILGLPTKRRVTDSWSYYNSLAIVRPNSEQILIYDKKFLYKVDELWAREGSSFLSRPFLDHFPAPIQGNYQPQKFGVGICMDINPYKFEAPFEAFEFANFHQQNNTDMLFCCMNWVLKEFEQPDISIEQQVQEALVQSMDSMEIVRYWCLRLHPLIQFSVHLHRPIIVSISNRIGLEKNVLFAGNSVIFKVWKGKIIILGKLDSNTTDILVADIE